MADKDFFEEEKVVEQPEEPQKTHYFLRIVKYIFHV